MHETDSISLLYGSNEFSPVTRRTRMAVFLTLLFFLVHEILALMYINDSATVIVYMIYPLLCYIVLLFLTFQIVFERIRLRRRGYLTFYKKTSFLVCIPLAIYSFIFVLIFILLQFGDLVPSRFKISDKGTIQVQLGIFLMGNACVMLALVYMHRLFQKHNTLRFSPDIPDAPTTKDNPLSSGGTLNWKHPNRIIDKQGGAIMFLQRELSRVKAELSSVYDSMSQAET
eukprot:UN29490